MGEMSLLAKVARLVLAVSFAGFLGAADSEPGDRWIAAYGWLQTGEKLAEAEQWPLAMGCFVEAHRQMEAIRKDSPNFEPELVGYRTEKLEVAIADTQERLATGEHDITMKFLDFIESYEKGMGQRFANQFADSLDTLEVARVLLDEIIFENPDEFRDAVDTQYSILHESIGWLDQQLNFKRKARVSRFTGDGVEWGTTRFVEEEDLPGEGDTVLTESDLFPRSALLAAGLRPTADAFREAVREEKAEGADAGKGDGEASSGKPARPGFRMSSRQKSEPVPRKDEQEE